MTLAAIVEAALFFAFTGILVFGGAWIFLYRALNRRLAALGELHPPGERHNGMDLFFHKVRFLAGSEDRRLKDPAVSRICLALRLSTIILTLCFLVMVFGPFCLGRE